jgi:hypothetical protein
MPGWLALNMGSAEAFAIARGQNRLKLGRMQEPDAGEVFKTIQTRLPGCPLIAADA